MNFIFPMGGLSQRFTNSGYNVQKFMLDLHGFSVFDHAVIGFERYFRQHSLIFAIRDDPVTEVFVRDKCRKMCVPDENVRIVKLDGSTSGQAETVWIANCKAELPPTDPNVIFNIDSFQSDFRLPTNFDFKKTDGYLEVFIGEGDHWSFFDSGENHSVICVTEKERVSNLCSSGQPYFRRAQDFNQAFENILDMDLSELQGGERYVAPLYNSLIEKNMLAKYHLVAPEDVTFCGTPEEYDALRSDAPPTTKLQERQNQLITFLATFQVLFLALSF